MSTSPLKVKSKMTLKVEVIAKQIIKPSSPTPNYLKAFQLSLMDQIAPIMHVPLLLFYSASANDMVENEKRLHHLMRSLSKTLTQYHHLAGRIEGNDFITCNDEGIDFFVARVNIQLNQLLCNHPKQDERMQLLLPITDKLFGFGPKMLLSIQANIFDCGAMALGVCIIHKVFDASSVSVFLNSWADVAMGNNDSIQPILGIKPFFPHTEGIPTFACLPENGMKKLITKRFVFDECNIAALKDKCCSSNNNSYIENPSRVESIIALIWMCVMNVVSMRAIGVKRKSAANISMNLRGRMIPPLSKNSVGNLVILATSTVEIDNYPKLLQFLVGQLRKAISKFDCDGVKKFQSWDGFMEHIHALGATFENEVEAYMFTSWCRFPFYDLDFGWGKPTWVSPVFNKENLIVLMDTKCGEGVEASVCMAEEDMDSFECQPELIAFTSGGTLKS